MNKLDECHDHIFVILRLCDRLYVMSSYNLTSVKDIVTKSMSFVRENPMFKLKNDFQPVWKWWEEEKTDDGTKWKFLQHKGPLFAPLYERLPDNVNFYYDGECRKC